MKSIFIGDENHLHHLSVGAVCLNQDNEVLVHNYERLQKEGDSRVFENIYTLMRETVENNESLEAALGRGMMEEFGAKGDILCYIGSRKTHFMRNGKKVEKTVLYFIVKLDGDPTRISDENIGETITHIINHPIHTLIPIMENQEILTGEANFNESEILKRTLSFLEKYHAQ